MTDDQDNTDVRDATPEEETMIHTIVAQRKQIKELEVYNKRLRLEAAHANDTADAAIERTKELEAELTGAINVAYGVSEVAGKRRGELEAKLAKAMQVVEMIASADVDAVLGQAVDLACEIIGELMEDE